MHCNFRKSINFKNKDFVVNVKLQTHSSINSVCHWILNCSSAVAQLCVRHDGTGQNVARPQAKWEQICRVQLFSLGPTLPRESALLTVPGSWVVLLLFLLFRSLFMTLFLGQFQ